MKKIITINNYLKLKETSLKSKKIVLVCGSFDMFHRGHLEFLEFSKAKGDILIVLLNSDSSIRKYKGSHRPIISQQDRAYILQALEVVDYVLIFNDLTPENYFKKILPDVFCNGLDWGKNFVGIDVLTKNRTKILYFGKKDSSVSSIIQRTQESLTINEIRYIFYDSNLFSIEKISFVKEYNFNILDINKILNIKKFLNFCKLHNIIINKSLYVGSDDTKIDFCKKVNLRVIKINIQKNESGEDYNIQSISKLKSLIRSLNS